jgi:hypothetical protein
VSAWAQRLRHLPFAHAWQRKVHAGRVMFSSLTGFCGVRDCAQVHIAVRHRSPKGGLLLANKILSRLRHAVGPLVTAPRAYTETGARKALECGLRCGQRVTFAGAADGRDRCLVRISLGTVSILLTEAHTAPLECNLLFEYTGFWGMARHSWHVSRPRRHETPHIGAHKVVECALWPLYGV